MLRDITLSKLKAFATLSKRRTIAAPRCPSNYNQISYLKPHIEGMSTEALQNWEAHYEQRGSSASNDFRSKSRH